MLVALRDKRIYVLLEPRLPSSPLRLRRLAFLSSVSGRHQSRTAARDDLKLNLDHRNFRLFSPDENNSNHCRDALEVTERVWTAERYPLTTTWHPKAGVAEMLSEHQCQGWLEGFFSCYEAFIALA